MADSLRAKRYIAVENRGGAGRVIGTANVAMGNDAFRAKLDAESAR